MKNDNKFYKERLLGNESYKVFIPEHPLIKRANINETGFNNGNLVETLKEDYTEIYDAIKEEEYFINDDEKYFYLFEIPDEKEEKIIGIATLMIYDKDSLIMNQIYVMPEYRGHKHFIATYNFFCELFNEAEIYVRNPSRTIIDNVVEADYGYIIKDRFLVSQLFFVFDQAPFEDTLNYTNKSFLQNGKMTKYFTETNLYDLKIDALIKLSLNNKIYTGKEDLMKIERSNISLVRDEDEKRFNILAKRNDDLWIQKGNYFKKISKIFKKEMIKISRDKNHL